VRKYTTESSQPQASWPHINALSRAPLPLRPGCLINKSDLAEARGISKAAHANGYRSLLKVHSPWSPYVDEDVAGKMPCTEVVDGQKTPWTRGHSLPYLMRRTPATANTGMVLGGADNLISLDIDPPKTGSAAARERFAIDVLRLLLSRQQLRQALIRLRKPGSALLLLRSDQPMTKVKVAGDSGAVELLGVGQQFLIDGWHPISRQGAAVRWEWMHGRAPWTVPAAELPIVSFAELASLIREIEVSGVLGPAIARATTTTTVVGQRRSAAYPATWRLHELFAKHDGRVRPAVRDLIEQVGAEGCGRHDAIVAVCGRLVLQKWPHEQVIEFLLPIVNAAFSDGCWLAEIEKGLAHARRRDAARVHAVRGTSWTR